MNTQTSKEIQQAREQALDVLAGRIKIGQFMAGSTLIDQVTALIGVAGELQTENKSLRDENTTLKGTAKTAQERAVEIAASTGVTIPAASDANKGAGKDGKNSTTLTGIEAVEAMYREKYGINGEKARGVAS